MTTLVPPRAASAVQTEPPGVWSAVRSRMALVVVIVLLFTVAGIAAGIHRHPKYSAAARLVVHLNFGTPGALTAFQTAGPVLSDTYARSIDANGVVQPLAAQFHTTVQTIRGELSAAAVPTSPVLIVTAKTLSRTTSIALANAAMGQLVLYLQSVNAANADAPRLYAQLKQAEAALAAAQNNETAVKGSIAAAMAASKAVTMSAAQQAKLSAAESAANIAADKEAGLRSSYDQSVTNGSDTQYLQPLQSASTASSDRSSRLLLYAFIGFVFGIGVATGVAVARQARALKKLRAA